MAENSMSFLELPYKILPMWNPNFLSTLTSCYSQQCDRGVYLCHSPIPCLCICCSFCLVGSSLLVCLATSNSSLRPIQSLILWHFPDTSLLWGRTYLYRYQRYLHPVYIYLCIYHSALWCLVYKSVYLTASTTEGLDHVNSFSYSQHLAECLILSKCMLNYK